jgi:hypothetical protein
VSDRNQIITTKLVKAGYRWVSDGDRYQVWYKDEYLGGASVKLPRDKPLHWKHRVANIVDNFTAAMNIIEKHALENNITI